MKMNLIDADLCIVHEPRFDLIARRLAKPLRTINLDFHEAQRPVDLV